MSFNIKSYEVFVFGIIGAVIGVALPDIDLTLPFLRHRSIVTHGFLWPLVAWLFVVFTHNVRFRFFTIGFATTLAIHLCYDLYPGGWFGFARIHVPGYGRLSGPVSWVWLSISVIISLYFALWLVWSMREIILLAISAAAPFLIMAADNEEILLPLISFGVALAFVFGISKIFHFEPEKMWATSKVPEEGE